MLLCMAPKAGLPGTPGPRDCCLGKSKLWAELDAVEEVVSLRIGRPRMFGKKRTERKNGRSVLKERERVGQSKRKMGNKIERRNGAFSCQAKKHPNTALTEWSIEDSGYSLWSLKPCDSWTGEITEFVPENYHFIPLSKYLSHWYRDPFPGLELVINTLAVGEVGRWEWRPISAVRTSDLLRSPQLRRISFAWMLWTSATIIIENFRARIRIWKGAKKLQSNYA